jgi:lysyl-tRNA synthetase class 2
LFIESKIENRFIQPTFLTNHPLDVGVPDKPDINDRLTRERAEVFVAKGFELANLGSINNDPKFLRNHNMWNLTNKFGKEPVDKYLDEDFLFEMEYGLPPLAGCGIGIDRLVMLLSGKDNINDTIIYPFKT